MKLSEKTFTILSLIPSIFQALAASEKIYQESLKALTTEMEDRRRRDIETAERKHVEEIAKLQEFHQGKLGEMRDQLEIGQYSLAFIS